VARTPEQLTIAAAGRSVAVRLRRSMRARRLQIQVGHDGAEIVLPTRSSVQQAREFLAERAGWVLAKLAELRATRSRVEQEHCLPDDAVLLAGEWLPLRIARSDVGRAYQHATDGRRIPRVSMHALRLAGGEVLVRLPAAAGAGPAVLVERWLRGLARREITRCVARRSSEMSVSPRRLFIRDQRTRWASCSSAGNLSFSWRLISAPPDVLDYVVVHELAHLLHMNHSKRFWRIVESHCGDVGRFRTWLRERSWLIREPIRLAPPATPGEQLGLWPQPAGHAIAT